jgi:hypothetical protein
MNRLVAAGLVGLVIIFGVTMSLNAYASYQEHMVHLAEFHATATAAAQEAAAYATAQADAAVADQETATAQAASDAQERARETATATAQSAEATVEAGKLPYAELCVDIPLPDACQRPDGNVVSLEQVNDQAHLTVGGGAAMVGDGSVTVDAWKVEADGSLHHMPCTSTCDASPLTRVDSLSGDSQTIFLTDILPHDSGVVTQTGTFRVDITIGGRKLPPYTFTITR